MNILRDALNSLRADIEDGYAPWKRHGITAEAYETLIDDAEKHVEHPVDSERVDAIKNALDHVSGVTDTADEKAAYVELEDAARYLLRELGEDV